MQPSAPGLLFKRYNEMLAAGPSPVRSTNHHLLHLLGRKIGWNPCAICDRLCVSPCPKQRAFFGMVVVRLGLQKRGHDFWDFAGWNAGRRTAPPPWNTLPFVAPGIILAINNACLRGKQRKVSCPFRICALGFQISREVESVALGFEFPTCGAAGHGGRNFFFWRLDLGCRNVTKARKFFRVLAKVSRNDYFFSFWVIICSVQFTVLIN